MNQQIGLISGEILHSLKLKDYRCGTILYNDTQIFLGIDERTLDITDFGGSQESKDATPLETCLRELKEETLNLIQITSCSKEALNSKVLIYTDILIAFIKYDEDFTKYVKLYQDKYREIKEIDISHSVGPRNRKRFGNLRKIEHSSVTAMRKEDFVELLDHKLKSQSGDQVREEGDKEEWKNVEYKDGHKRILYSRIKEPLKLAFEKGILSFLFR
jgi:hypothetical protein